MRIVKSVFKPLEKFNNKNCYIDNCKYRVLGSDFFMYVTYIYIYDVKRLILFIFQGINLMFVKKTSKMLMYFKFVTY